MSQNNCMHDPEKRAKVSRTRAALIAEGRIVPTFVGHHGSYQSFKTGEIETYHSHLELDRMRILDADPDVLFWTKKHKVVLTYKFNDAEFRYVPDFLIQKSGTLFIEEVKGWEGEPKTPAKLLALQNHCSETGCVMSYMNTAQIMKELQRFDLERTLTNGNS